MSVVPYWANALLCLLANLVVMGGMVNTKELMSPHSGWIILLMLVSAIAISTSTIWAGHNTSAWIRQRFIRDRTRIVRFMLAEVGSALAFMLLWGTQSPQGLRFLEAGTGWAGAYICAVIGSLLAGIGLAWGAWREVRPIGRRS